MIQEIIDILLVEDNPYDYELMLRALQRNNVANPIHHVADGAAALDFIFCRGAYSERNLVQLPKVILLDLKLQKINGLEVLRQIKQDERTKCIPVVVVTSSAQDPDIKTAYALGANSYVVKPVEFDAFVEEMKNLGYYWLLVNEPPK
jgi:two-component system response regulator